MSSIRQPVKALSSSSLTPSSSGSSSSTSDESSSCPTGWYDGVTVPTGRRAMIRVKIDT